MVEYVRYRKLAIGLMFNHLMIPYVVYMKIIMIAMITMMITIRTNKNNSIVNITLMIIVISYMCIYIYIYNHTFIFLAKWVGWSPLCPSSRGVGPWVLCLSSGAMVSGAQWGDLCGVLCSQRYLDVGF